MTCQLIAVRLDANDPQRLADFWGGLVGWEKAQDPQAGVALVPHDDTGFRLGFRRTQELKPGQDEMHFHLTSSSLADQQRTVARALELGGRHIDVGQRPEEGHVVLADPEGNEFCVIEPANKWLAGCGYFAEITCVGSPAVGYFWSEALGWPLVLDQDLQTSIRSPHGGPKISWDQAPPRTGKFGLQFDVVPAAGGDRKAEVDRLAALGATRVGAGPGGGWEVLADPDGHEFRVLTRPPGRG